MEIQEIRERLWNDDAFAIEQLDRLALFYNLKHTIRWAHDRSDTDLTESVAEHVYGLHILIDFLVPIIDADNTLDIAKLHTFATWHDMAETIVTDMPTRTKTDEHKEAEKRAEQDLVANAHAHEYAFLEMVFGEYDAQATPEAKIMKALDKLEPMFHLYFLTKKGFEEQYFDLVWSASAYRKHRRPYLESFELLVRIDDILYEKTKHLHPEE